MGSLIAFLNGKKSYFVAACMAALVFLKQINKIDEATYTMLQSLLIGG